MKTKTWIRGIGGVCLGVGVLVASMAHAAPSQLVVERAAMVIRHGIRAPLDGEVPSGTRTAAPWPTWPVAESRVTPHGVRALEIVAAQDRALFVSKGLISANGCPAVRIHSNSSDRTIASGAAYANGFAPGCHLAVDHRPIGTIDPIFEPLRAGATTFDPALAIASINRDTGGMAVLANRHRVALATLGRILGCAQPDNGCVPTDAPAVTPSADGREIVLAGPIRAASGVAQVLLLQEVQGLPRNDVGWGRVDLATLQQIGTLHAALFAVFTHPPYMAAHQAAVLGREVLGALSSPGPRLTVFMGHDTTVTALASALRVELPAPGYATNDVPPGGALLIERLRDRQTGARFVRVSYRTQSPAALRQLGRETSLTTLTVPGCGTALCPAARFARVLTAHLAPLASAGTKTRP